MKLIIDSSAWIEYLNGSDLGRKVYSLLSKENKVYAIEIIIGEVISKIKRMGKDYERAYEAILSNSAVINITPELAKKAGFLHADIKASVPGFSLADAFIVTL